MWNWLKNTASRVLGFAHKAASHVGSFAHNVVRHFGGAAGAQKHPFHDLMNAKNNYYGGPKPGEPRHFHDAKIEYPDANGNYKSH